MATEDHAGRAIRLPLVLELQPEGGFTVTSPLVPELITEGDSLEEVMANVLEAWQVVLDIYRDDGRPLPAELYVDGSKGPITLDALVPA